MTAVTAQTDEPQPDQVSVVFGLFEGDANSTIAALLAELQFVRGQLALYEAGMSVGLPAARQRVPLLLFHYHDGDACAECRFAVNRKTLASTFSTTSRDS